MSTHVTSKQYHALPCSLDTRAAPLSEVKTTRVLLPIPILTTVERMSPIATSSSRIASPYALSRNARQLGVLNLWFWDVSETCKIFFFFFFFCWLAIWGQTWGMSINYSTLLHPPPKEETCQANPLNEEEVLSQKKQRSSSYRRI